MAQGSGTRSPPVVWWGSAARILDYNIYLDATHRTVWGTGEGPHPGLYR